MEEANVKKFYLDKKIDFVPTYYNRDIIKILLVNPKSIYILWGISEASYSKIKESFHCNLEDINFRLAIHFKTENKIQKSKLIELPPFTNNWFVNFEEKAKEIKAEVLAFSSAGNSYSLLHSAEIHLPAKKESLQIHQEWIHPNWLEYSNEIKIGNDIFLIEKKAEQFSTDLTQQKQIDSFHGNNPFLKEDFFSTKMNSSISSFSRYQNE
jgi:hypothetical protein